MVSEVSLQLGLSETLSHLYLPVLVVVVVVVVVAVLVVAMAVVVGTVLVGGSHCSCNESSQFQEFPEAVLSCLSLVLKSFLAGWTVSVS